MFDSPFAARRLGRDLRRSFQPRLETLEERLTPTGYSLTDLGNPGYPAGYSGAPVNAVPYAINASGQIVTTSTAYTGVTGVEQVFENSNGQWYNLGAPNGYTQVTPFRINDAGRVFVDARTTNGQSHQIFESDNGGWDDLGPSETYDFSTVAVNNSGQMLCNVSWYSQNYPMLYSNGQWSNPVSAPSGYNSSQPYALNNSGQALCFASKGSGASEGYLLNNGQWADLKLSSGRGLVSSAGLNDSGQVVFQWLAQNFASYVFLYSNGQLTDLNTLLPSGYGSPSLVSFNDAGQVLADASTGSGSSAITHLFMYSNGQWTDLNNFMPSGSSVTLSGPSFGLLGATGPTTVDINDNGQILAQGTDGNIYLLSPQQSQQSTNTSTSLSASASSIATGRYVTLTATVTDTPGGNAPPGGSVTFHNGPTTLETVGLTGGKASLSATLPVGDNSITATYNGFTQGNTVFETSTSLPVIVTVGSQSAPTITSVNSAVFTISQNGGFTVTATGSPTPTLTESGALPEGIAFADNGNGTATLAGTPMAGTLGTYHFTISAHNGVGSDFTQDFALIVSATSSPPSTSSPSTSSATAQPTPPALNVPPLLALFDGLLGGTETVNANDTETITDSLLGIPLLVATFDPAGNLVSVTLFGIDVTFLFGQS